MKTWMHVLLLYCTAALKVRTCVSEGTHKDRNVCVCAREGSGVSDRAILKHTTHMAAIDFQLIE